MVNISNYYVCWLNFSIYCVMLIEFILKVIVMWIAVEKWWIGSECEWFVCNWLTYVLLLRMRWMWYMLSWWLGYWDMLKVKEWFELWDCGLEICGNGLKWWTMWIVCVWW